MKGFHTQGLAVLFAAAPGLEAIGAALARFEPVPIPAADDGGWMGAAGFRLPMPLGGVAIVDVFHRRWPDAMGDPKGDVDLFGAWGMGFLGPLTFPGGLERAARHAYHWKRAGEAAAGHHSFVRIRTTYAAGAKPDDPVFPPGYDARAELDRVTALAEAICALDGALAFFDPNGEVLLAPDALRRCLTNSVEQRRAPIEAWTNVRMFRFEAAAPWMAMDTVGMGQLDRADLEACFPSDGIEAKEVAVMLRNVSLYLLDEGEVVEDGHTLDGPGGVWRARKSNEPLFDPPRPTLRLFPEAAGTAPDLLQRGIAPERKGLWRRLLGR